MRKLVCGLFAILIGIGTMHAKTYSDKTFLATRSTLDNMAMEYTGYHKQTRKMLGKRWGGAFQVTGFYQESTNKTELGKYFGKYNSATGGDITNPYAGQIQDFVWVLNRPTPTATNSEMYMLLDPDYIIHDHNGKILNADKLAVKGQFRPHQTIYGLRLDYHQKLDKLAEGLYFKVSAPVVHVKNSMGISYTGTKTSQYLPYTTKSVCLNDYLGGCLTQTAPNCSFTQDSLRAAKISRCHDDSTTGVDDIEVLLGYNFLYKTHKHVGVNVAMTIPTDRTPRGTYLFESTLGHRGHWSLGMGVDAAFELWERKKKSLEFIGSIKGKYLLAETEKRTIGFKHKNDADSGYGLCPNLIAGKLVPMGWYMLGAKNGAKGVFPLANVLTRDVTVRPGWQVEGLAQFTFNWRDFTFDLGYNLFAKERESVMVRCWSDNTYAVAEPNLYDPSLDFDGNGTWIQANNWIQKEHLITEPAASPVYVTHKVYAGANYAFNKWEFPLLLGLGGSWEFAQGDNSAINGWALWLKAGLTF